MKSKVRFHNFYDLKCKVFVACWSNIVDCSLIEILYRPSIGFSLVNFSLYLAELTLPNRINLLHYKPVHYFVALRRCERSFIMEHIFILDCSPNSSVEIGYKSRRCEVNAIEYGGDGWVICDHFKKQAEYCILHWVGEKVGVEAVNDMQFNVGGLAVDGVFGGRMEVVLLRHVLQEFARRVHDCEHWGGVLAL